MGNYPPEQLVQTSVFEVEELQVVQLLIAQFTHILVLTSTHYVDVQICPQMLEVG